MLDNKRKIAIAVVVSLFVGIWLANRQAVNNIATSEIPRPEVQREATEAPPTEEVDVEPTPAPPPRAVPRNQVTAREEKPGTEALKRAR